MGIDWEGILGDTSYEDAVEIARESLYASPDDDIDMSAFDEGGYVDENIDPYDNEMLFGLIYDPFFADQKLIAGTNRMIIPTLFKIGKIEKNANGMATGRLSRIYDQTICAKHMEVGNYFNALLPYTEPLNNVPYTYGGSQDIQFLLPEKPNNRMMYLKLIAKGDEVEQYIDKCQVRVCFRKRKDKNNSANNKGTIEFNCALEEYNTSLPLGYLLLTDEENNTRYVFDSHLEDLPVPGDVDKFFAYVDGSAGDVDDQEHFGSGAVVSILGTVYLSHCEGDDKGRNVSAEYLAATKLFEHFPETKYKIIQLDVYYDNNNVGYIPAGLYQPGTDYARNYIAAIEKFEKEHPDTVINFVHTDGHSGIFGNEMADEMAEHKRKELDRLKHDFEEKRKALCPEDGSFSEGLKLVSPVLNALF